jgi:YbbR domain-containing protein
MDRWLRNPNVVRVIALLLGVLLWFVVHMEGQQSPSQSNWMERSTSKEIEQVGLEVVGLDESRYELVSIEPMQVRIRVTGLPNVLSRVTTETARVRLDLSTAVSGVQQMQLEPAGFPEQVDVDIFPSSVTVTIEEKLMREMPVVINVTGEPAGGYVAGTPTVQPNRVYVTYRESGIDAIAEVRGSVDVGGASATVRKQIRLFAYNADGERMEAIIEPSVVEVEVPVTHPARTMPLQIGLTGEPAEGFAVADFEQTPLEVSVFGEERVLNRLEFYAGGSVDVTGLREDATFNVTLPKTDGVSQLEPETAQVKVRIVPSVRKSFSGVRLNLAGVRANLEAAIRDPRDGVVTVTLEGAEQTLNGLEANDIDLIVDVSNLTPGVHQVEVSYSLPAFVRVVSDGSPLAVTVEIREADAEESGTSPEGPRDEEPGSGDAGTGGSGSGSTSGRDDGDDDNDPADNDGLSEVSENGGSPDGINMQVLMHRFFGTGA